MDLILAIGLIAAALVVGVLVGFIVRKVFAEKNGIEIVNVKQGYAK